MENPDKQENTRDEEGKWLPGKSGNPQGRPKRKTLTELIHERLDKDPEGWQELVTVILSMAKRKDKEIIKELWHYTDGMPKQSTNVDVTSGGKPIVPLMGGTSVSDDNIIPETSDTKKEN